MLEHLENMSNIALVAGTVFLTVFLFMNYEFDFIKAFSKT